MLPNVMTINCKVTQELCLQSIYHHYTPTDNSIHLCYLSYPGPSSWNS